MRSRRILQKIDRFLSARAFKSSRRSSGQSGQRLDRPILARGPRIASRLASVARPRGLIAHYDVSTWMFDLVEDNVGRIVTLDKIKDYDADIKIWCDANVKLPGETLSLNRK